MRRRELKPESVASVTEDMLINSGVPRKFWNAQLGAVDGDPEFKSLIREFMRDIHEHAKDGMGLLLRGSYGSGKTSLAVTLLKVAIQRGGLAHFVQSRDLPAVYFDDATIDRSFEEPIVIKDRLRTCNLIVIDDLGAESFDTHGNAGALIEGVLRDAYNEEQIVVVTTNCNEGELRSRFNKGVISLLHRMTTAVEINSDQWQKHDED